MQRGEQTDVVFGKQTTLTSVLTQQDCVVLEWNKCGLFSNKHNGTASIQIAIASQHYSNNQYKNLQRKIIKCNSNIYFNKHCVNGKLLT